MHMDEINPRETLRVLVGRFETQSDAAASLSVSKQYLNDLLHGRRTFSLRLLKKLGLKRVVVPK